jgi:hypothetical protein
MVDDELAVTRKSLHAVAELVLAGPQYRATGTVRLGIVPGGLATTRTPKLLVDGSRVTGADGVTVGHDALVGFAPGETPVVWPEHFDVAIRVHEANFGVSPGDGFIDEPYAYAGVSAPPAGDSFWNAPFGAARPLRELPNVSAVTGYFAEGSKRAR